MTRTAEDICRDIERTVVGLPYYTSSAEVAALQDAALNAVQFLRTRLTAAAYRGDCHHCDESLGGEPCWWCGLVDPELPKPDIPPRCCGDDHAEGE